MDACPGASVGNNLISTVDSLWAEELYRQKLVQTKNGKEVLLMTPTEKKNMEANTHIFV